MSIKLSYSSISDYLRCKAKVFYRTNFQRYAVSSEEMITGDIVHKAIELYWENQGKAMAFAKQEVEKNKLSEKFENLTKLCVSNFFNGPHELVGKDDKIECSFEIPLFGDNEVTLRGKIDRIAMNGKYPYLIDWKTGGEYLTPEELSCNAQFIIYECAMKKLYGDAFVLLHVALKNKKISSVRVDKEARDLLFNEVIPAMLSDIRQDRLFKSGLFTGECKHCSYTEMCLGDRSKNVVESSSFIT